MRILASCLETGGISSYIIRKKSIKLEEVWNPAYSDYKMPDDEGRELHVQRSASFIYGGKKYLLLGRKGLILDILIDSLEGLMLVKRKALISGQVRSDFFVELEVNCEINDNSEKEYWIRCCTGFGYCYFIKLEKLMDSKFDNFAMSFGMSGFVGFFKMFKFNREVDSNVYLDENWKIVYGGKDRGVNVLDMKDHRNIWKSKSVAMTKIKKTGEIPMKDTVEEPLWIQDISLLKDGDNFEDLKILAITKFGKLLKYYPFFSKYPIDEYQVFDQIAIKNIVKLSYDMIIINDGFNDVLLFDVENWKILKKFNVITGSLSVLKTIKINVNDYFEVLKSDINSIHLIFITSNVDKFLRVYLLFETSTGEWVIELISKHKTNGIITDLSIHDEDILPYKLIEKIIQKYLNDGKQSLKHLNDDEYNDNEEMNNPEAKRSKLI